MISLFVIPLLIVTLAVQVCCRLKPNRQQLRNIILFSLGLALGIGVVTGDMETRHVDIPWWFVSLLLVLPIYCLAYLLRTAALYNDEKAADSKANEADHDEG